MPTMAQLLQRRFVEQASVQGLARERSVAESTLYVMQRTAIERLTAALLTMEQAAWATHSGTLRTRIEAASSVQLVGVDHLRNGLVAQLAADGPPWLLAV